MIYYKKIPEKEFNFEIEVINKLFSCGFSCLGISVL